MANTKEINAYFSDDKKYFENSIGSEFYYSQAMGPYEYLLGALAGCYISTLYSYERKSSWKELTVNVKGTKRDTVPTTLEETDIIIRAKEVEDKKEFETLARRAVDECSIFQTISKVSKMNLDIIYED